LEILPTTPFAIIAISWTNGGECMNTFSQLVDLFPGINDISTSFNFIDPPIDEIVTNSGSKKLGAHLLVLNLMHGTFFG